MSNFATYGNIDMCSVYVIWLNKVIKGLCSQQNLYIYLDTVGIGHEQWPGSNGECSVVQALMPWVIRSNPFINTTISITKLCIHGKVLPLPKLTENYHIEISNYCVFLSKLQGMHVQLLFILLKKHLITMVIKCVCPVAVQMILSLWEFPPSSAPEEWCISCSHTYFGQHLLF